MGKNALRQSSPFPKAGYAPTSHRHAHAREAVHSSMSARLFLGLLLSLASICIAIHPCIHPYRHHQASKRASSRVGDPSGGCSKTDARRGSGSSSAGPASFTFLPATPAVGVFRRDGCSTVLVDCTCCTRIRLVCTHPPTSSSLAESIRTISLGCSWVSASVSQPVGCSWLSASFFRRRRHLCSFTSDARCMCLQENVPRLDSQRSARLTYSSFRPA